MPERKYRFPVWGTQGGGLVREIGPDRYIFVEAPARGTGLDVGDEMPSEWSIVPANEPARIELEKYDFPEES